MANLTRGNSSIDGILPDIAALQATSPNLNTRLELVTGERYKVDSTDEGQGVLLTNGRYANPVFNQANIRYSKMDNPLFHGFKANDLSSVSAPLNTDADITWARSTIKKIENRYGDVETVAIDTPSEEKEGFLIEGASTNLLTYSEQFDNAAWLKANVTLTADYGAAPDGATTADRAQLTAAAGYALQNTSITSGNSYTLSCWVKATTGSSEFFRLSFENGLYQEAFEATDKWQRFDLTATALTTAVASHGVIAGSVGADVLVWGAQLEELPFASSYIQTTAASATRTADNVSLVYKNNLALGSNGYSFCATIDTIGSMGAGFDQVMLQAGTTLGDNGRYFLARGNGSITGLLSGAGICQGVTTLAVGEQAAVIGVDNLTNITYSEKGNLLVTNTSSPNIIDDDTLTVHIGSNSGANAYLFGHIKDFRVYDFSLNTDEITYLSGQ